MKKYKITIELSLSESDFAFNNDLLKEALHDKLFEITAYNKDDIWKYAKVEEDIH